MNIAYLNGEKCLRMDVVSLYNPSFLYGVNCFEGVRAYWNALQGRTVFLDLGAHLDRLYESMAAISFPSPISRVSLETHIRDVLERESVCEDVYVRITIFIGGDGSWRTTDGIHYLVSIRSQPSSIRHSDPVRLGISAFQRISAAAMPPHVKAGANYLNSRYALLDVQARGFDDALFLTADKVISEATGSSVFFIEGNTLVTPSLDCDLLRGITRERVLSHCRQMKIPVEEARIERSAIERFDGAFLCGTSIELKEVSSIECHRLTENHPLFGKIRSDFVARIDAGNL